MYNVINLLMILGGMRIWEGLGRRTRLRGMGLGIVLGMKALLLSFYPN
jgi:hypothetical protein